MEKKKYYETPAMTVIAMETPCMLADSDVTTFSVGGADDDDNDSQIEKATWD